MKTVVISLKPSVAAGRPDAGAYGINSPIISPIIQAECECIRSFRRSPQHQHVHTKMNSPSAQIRIGDLPFLAILTIGAHPESGTITRKRTQVITCDAHSWVIVPGFTLERREDCGFCAGCGTVGVTAAGWCGSMPAVTLARPPAVAVIGLKRSGRTATARVPRRIAPAYPAGSRCSHPMLGLAARSVTPAPLSARRAPRALEDVVRKVLTAPSRGTCAPEHHDAPDVHGTVHPEGARRARRVAARCTRTASASQVDRDQLGVVGLAGAGDELGGRDLAHARMTCRLSPGSARPGSARRRDARRRPQGECSPVDASSAAMAASRALNVSMPAFSSPSSRPPRDASGVYGSAGAQGGALLLAAGLTPGTGEGRRSPASCAQVSGRYRAH